MYLLQNRGPPKKFTFLVSKENLAIVIRDSLVADFLMCKTSKNSIQMRGLVIIQILLFLIQ